MGTGNTGLCILGESGSGKSALLANWGASYRQAHPDALVLQHYVGATPYSADWAAMLRRLMGEFKRRLGLQQDIPDHPDALRSAFPNWLYMANAQVRSAGSEVRSPAFTRTGPPEGGTPNAPSKIIIVLDALNQLEDRDGAPDLVWLPPVLPENVRFIVSTLPGRSLDEIQKRHWPTLKVELLSADERRKLIAEYLAQHAKSLKAARVERIAAAPPSANPLYLRVLLDELRMVCTHEELEERIGDYLKAESPYALYEKVIARWEQDYEGDSDLVGDTLSLLWAARRGLTESELLRALGKDGEPLPRAKWSPLFLAMSDALVSRGGLLTFAHDFLRTAARETCLPTESHQQRVHSRLAEYFERQPVGPRRTDELPWQLAKARAWQRLHDLLADRVFFNDAWGQNEFEVKTYWAQVEAGSPLRMVGAYDLQLVSPEAEADKNYLWRLSILLSDAGYPEEALRLRSALVRHFREINDLSSLQGALNNQAAILQVSGDLDGAMVLHKEGAQICQRLGNLDGLAATLGNQAGILEVRGDLDGAMALLKKAEQICRQLGSLDGLSAMLGNQALILKVRGDLEGAITLNREAERICRQLGNLDGLQTTLGNQAAILQMHGELDGAMTLLKEQERICRQLGMLDSLSRTFAGQANILQTHGELDGAMALLKEQERICRQVGNLNDLQQSLGSQAWILKARGNLDEAMALLKESEHICRQLGTLHGLSKSLGSQGLILKDCGDLDGAKALLKETERICRQLGDLDGLQATLNNQALIFKEHGDWDGAMALHREAERICRELGHVEGLSATLGNQALILQDCGDLDGAMALLKEVESICQQMADVAGLARCLTAQALVIAQMGRAREGVSLAEGAHRIATQHEYEPLIAVTKAVLDELRRTAQNDDCGNTRGVTSETSSFELSPLAPTVSIPDLLTQPQREISLEERRESAARYFQKGLWEAAASDLQKLLDAGESLSSYAPKLITCLLNAHETPLTSDVKHIEALLQRLEQAGYSGLAAPLRLQLQAKLPRKRGWKFW